MRLLGAMAGLALATVFATAAGAQTPAPDVWAPSPSGEIDWRVIGPEDDFRDFTASLDGGLTSNDVVGERLRVLETQRYRSVQRDVWSEGEGFTDRVRLRARGEFRRADGAPTPPRLSDPITLEPEAYDVSFIRGWEAASGRTPSGLEVSLTPHAGVGIGSDGGTAEAGATLRIGSGLDRLVPEGQDAFGERPRWYLYAAGSGRAVGYNFARTRDGDFARSGYSHDSGNFLGDASLGVAYRRGAMQGSVGLVYREIEPGALRHTGSLENDVTEGLFAFQLSIKPE